MPVPFTAIDSHAHVFTRALPLAAVRRHAPEADATLDTYLALLDAHGVSHGVLVQPSFLGTDNRFLLEALSTAPDRLRGVAVVEPGVAEEALQSMALAGVCGIRLNLVGLPLPDVRTADWQALFARVRGLDWHVELHAESHRLAEAAAAPLAAGCKLVIDHFGRPTAGAMKASGDPGFAWLLATAETGQVWVKLSAAYRNWSPEILASSAQGAAHALLRAFGADRLVWGSDWPHTQHRDLADYASARTALDEWITDAAARQRILVDTPARLFHFKSTPGDNHDFAHQP